MKIRAVGRLGYAAGLSAVSFSAALQKDAAPIPDATEGRMLKAKAMEQWGWKGFVTLCMDGCA